MGPIPPFLRILSVVEDSTEGGSRALAPRGRIQHPRLTSLTKITAHQICANQDTKILYRVSEEALPFCNNGNPLAAPLNYSIQ